MEKVDLDKQETIVSPRDYRVEPLSVLLICSGPTANIGTVLDHIAAFKTQSIHDITIADATFVSVAAIELDSFDVLVFHYSIVLSDSNHIRPELAERIRTFCGLKVAFIQDEYRWIDRQNTAIEDFGISLLYTVTNPDVTRQIYRTSYFEKVRIEHTLTGFVPESLLTYPVPSYAMRAIDVSYRARRAPAWYGRFAEEKFLIGEKFRQNVEGFGLVCDIEYAEHRRVYGADWIKLISSSKATLGTESGVSFIDFTGEIQEQAEAYERDNPESSSSLIREIFLGNRDGQITINVISPRIFEAAALRTLLVLYPGEYSGVLKPWRHYIPLARDHSNLQEIIEIIQSSDKALKIIDAAYHEVACNPTWWLGTFIESFDKVIYEEYAKLARNIHPARARISSELARQWALRQEFDVVTSQLGSIKPAYDTLVVEYQKLASEYQKLATKYQLAISTRPLLRVKEFFALKQKLKVRNKYDSAN